MPGRSISEINASKLAGPMGYFQYTWQDVKDLADHAGNSTAFCPACGDLCIGQPGDDALFNGWAQIANKMHNELPCLDVIVMGTQW